MACQLALLTLICQLLVPDNGQDALGAPHGSALVCRLGSSHYAFHPASSSKPLPLLLIKAVMEESQFWGNLFNAMPQV